MRNTIKVLGIIVFLTVIGFSMTACTTTNGGGNAGKNEVYVSIEYVKIFPDGMIIQLALSDGVKWKTKSESLDSYDPSLFGAEINDVWDWFTFTDNETGNAVFTDITSDNIRGQTIEGMVSIDSVSTDWGKAFTVNIRNDKLDEIKRSTNFSGSLKAGETYHFVP